MDKITVVKIAGVASLIPMLYFMGGCSTTPPANINIGGMESCPPATLTLNIINETDKATIGPDSDINDADAGITKPSLGL